MPSTYTADVIVRIRSHLFEATADKWTDTQLGEYIVQAVGDLSKVVPYVTSSATYLLGGTQLIDISSLNYYNILKVEYEYGIAGEHPAPKEFKNFEINGGYLEIITDSVPSGDEYVTGTCNANTASSLTDTTLSQFVSDMAYSKVVNETDDWESYVTTYTSTSVLVLAEDIFPDGNEEYTIYERVPVKVWYETKHTYSATERTFNQIYEDLLVDGVVAYAMMGLATYSVNRANIAGSDVDEGYLALAKMKFTLYRDALKRLRPVKTHRRYA